MAASAAENQKLRERLGKVHVLVADADRRISWLVKDVLSSMGFQHVHVVHDGATGIQLLRDQPIDLIITDWVMKPMNGLDFVRYLRTAPDSPNRQIPILMLTGNAEKYHVETARDVGVDEFVVKPFSIKTLFDRLILVIENPRQFVLAKDFKGPDRRRRKTPPTPGAITEKRGKAAGKTLSAVAALSEVQIAAIDRGEMEHQLIEANYSLKTKIGEDVSIKTILEPEWIKASETIIAQHMEAFFDWAREDFKALDQLFREGSNMPGAQSDIMLNMADHAFAMKSQAGIFGYSLASQVANSLYHYCTRPNRNREGQWIVIKQHIDALRSIFQLRIEGEGDRTGRELLESLQRLTRKYP